MIKLWSTDDVAIRDRLAYWADGICDTFLHVDCRPQREGHFFGEIRADTLDEVLVAQATSTAQMIVRSPRQIARDTGEFLAITVQLGGRGMASQGERDLVLRPGDLIVLDGNRPFRWTLPDDFCHLVFQLPRKAFWPRLGEPERFRAIRIDGSAGMGGLLSPVLQKLPEHLAEIPDPARARIGNNVLDLIATAILAQGEGVPLPPETALARVKLWINSHWGGDLSAERIAATCRLSVRHINRLFAREGTSLMHYVWERRLACCRRDLIDPAMRPRPISDIAFSAGFKELSHFNRAYRERYGCTPSEARHIAMGK
jgi:AraC-like DNA-binding protein